MAYHGMSEFICKKGHYWRVMSGESYNGFTKKHITCSICETRAKWQNEVDFTNGSYADQPSTMPGAKKPLLPQPILVHDHRGTQYSMEIPRYQPIDWKEV